VSVVVTGPFIIFLLHNHFITEKILKKKSGDVNDEANFSLFMGSVGQLGAKNLPTVRN
jgi:hypothetical protein